MVTMDHVASTTKRHKTKGIKNESIRLRLTTAEKAAFTKAAEKQGRDLSNWLRWLASREAGLTK